MELIIVGANHKQTPLNIRECLSLTKNKQHQLLSLIKEDDSLAGGVVLSTCNRTELYLCSEKRSAALEFAYRHLSAFAELEINQLQRYLYKYIDQNALRHLFRVAAGLDSLVIGEPQILGQLKTAFQEARQLDTVDSYLYQAFTDSFRVGKRARSETAINSGAASVSYVAVELARKIFGSLSGETVLILGAGETSELTLKTLVEHGVKAVLVANRTYQRACQLAGDFNGKAISWEELPDWVGQVNIIISSTAAPHYVLHYQRVKEIMEQKRGPLFLIDIAVPRDIEPAVRELAGVHLYDLDDLELVLEQNLLERQEELKAVEKIISEELTNFNSWLQNRQCIPIIKAMRGKAELIKKEEINWALEQLNNSDKTIEEIIEIMADRLLNKVLHNPTMGIRDLATDEQAGQKLAVVKELFN